MVRRHNRLLVAFHVVTDAVLGMVAFFLAYLLRFETGLIEITRGHPPIEQYVNVLPFVALIVPLGFLLPGPLPAAARPLAHRRLLQRAGRQHLRGGARRGGDAVLPGVLRQRRAARRRRLRSVAHRLGHLPGPQHRARLPVAQVHSRGARTALAGGHRPAQDPDCRRRRSRPRGRGSHPRASRARLPDRRVRGRQGGRRSPRLPRAAAARLAERRRRRSSPTSRSTISTWRCRSKST